MTAHSPLKSTDGVADTKMELSRTTYAILGLCAGFGVGIWAIIEDPKRFQDLRILAVLAGGIIFGTIAGLNLYSWRNLGRGKIAFVVRWTLACGGAAGFIALIGFLLGLLPRAEVWQVGTVGAFLGFALSLRLLFDAARDAT